jgi:CheY-like chemotaxis protein
MPQGGAITVALDNVECGLETIPGVDIRPGRYVRLTVSDTGEGISPEHLDRIFDPYFTTKERGTGLGLAISYSIIHAHGGAITAASSPGAGATFNVYVPSATHVMPAARPDVPVPAAVTRPLRVLLMDDDEMVAEVASEMLETLGHTAVVTPSGDKAVTAFVEAENSGAPFDVVILDLTVPGGMGGADALPLIRERRANAVVFVTSGYADDGVLANFREYGFDGVLPKPFALPDLRRMLAAAAS